MIKSKLTSQLKSPEAEKLLSTELPRIDKEVKDFAHDLAVDQLPKEHDPASGYVPTILSLFQSLLEEILLLLQAGKARLEGYDLNQIFKDKEKRLQKKIQKLGQDSRVLKRCLRELGEDVGYRIGRWKISLIALVLLTIADVMANFQFFEIISTTKIMALAVASGLALSIFLLAHQTKKILNLTQRKERKVLAFMGMMILMTLVFYTVGSLRLIYGESNVTQSPWPVVVINLFMFIVSSLLVYFYSVSTEDKIRYEKQNELKKQIEKLTNNQDQLKDELDNVPEEKHERLMELYSILQLAKHYENRIVSEYLKSFYMFCRENALTRKDGVVPKSFDEDPTDLKTYFDDIV